MRRAALGATLAACGLLIVPLAGAQAAQPTCTIVDFTFTETDGGTVSHAWNLACSNPTTVTESATFQTVDATAKSPGDYIAFGGTLSVPQGLSSRPILIDVVGDDVPEPEEVFSIRFEDAEGVVQFRDSTGAGPKNLSVVTLVDDDGFTISSISRSAPEGDTGSSSVDVEVRLSDPVDRPYNVQLFTQDITATAGSDYEFTNQTMTFQPGDVSELAPITIFGDTEDEADETFFLGLSIQGSSTLRSGHVTIVDDDAGGGGGGGPCIVLSDTAQSVSGPASTLTERRFAGPVERLTMTNCGDSTVGIDVRGTDATGPGATWLLTDQSSGFGVDSICELGSDLYRADLTIWLPGGGGVGTSLKTSAKRLLGADGLSPFAFDPGEEQEISPQVELPCDDSSGLGQPMTIDVVLTAVAP